MHFLKKDYSEHSLQTVETKAHDRSHRTRRVHASAESKLQDDFVNNTESTENKNVTDKHSVGKTKKQSFQNRPFWNLILKERQVLLSRNERKTSIIHHSRPGDYPLESLSVCGIFSKLSHA